MNNAGYPILRMVSITFEGVPLFSLSPGGRTDVARGFNPWEE
jgi:hypothetical protein